MKLAVSNSKKLTDPNAVQKRRYPGGRGGVRPAESPKRMPYKNLDQVIGYMKDYYQTYKIHPAIRKKAIAITKRITKDPRTNLPNRRNHQAIADAIYEWAKRNIAYTNDPDGVELLQSPVKTLKYGFGDCDDYTTLAATLMASLGIPVRFKLAKTNPQNKDAYSHIYLEYNVNGQWHPFDLTLHKKAGTGIADAMQYGERAVPLSDSNQQESSGKKARQTIQQVPEWAQKVADAVNAFKKDNQQYAVPDSNGTTYQPGMAVQQTGMSNIPWGKLAVIGASALGIGYSINKFSN